MGFTTWPFGPNLEDVENTYAFINENSDIYAEHIDNSIPWNAWINNLPLPTVFSNEIESRVSRKLENKELLLSVGLFNLNRDELAHDLDGSVPVYQNLNDQHIQDAYFKHVDYLVHQFQPQFLVVAIEVNEFRLNSPNQWDAYVQLISNVKMRLKVAHPNLNISESISLHNLYQPNIPNTDDYINDIFIHANQLDFIAVSFYPFLKGLNSQQEYQAAFDFLHELSNRPLAFVETAHIAENLIVQSLNLSISGNEQDQNSYLETLFFNAEEQDYEFIIWWTHRDYDQLWETFPDELRDLGQLWRDTGLLDENGNPRTSIETWHDNFGN